MELSIVQEGVIEMLRTTTAKNGFESILFPANNRKDKVVIVVSGSNGGMRMTKDCAGFYCKNGIIMLFNEYGDKSNQLLTNARNASGLAQDTRLNRQFRIRPQKYIFGAASKNRMPRNLIIF